MTASEGSVSLVFSWLILCFFGFQDWGAALIPVFALFRHNSRFKPGEALEVIGEVRHADLDAGAGDADRAHDQAHAMLLACKDVFDC